MNPVLASTLMAAAGFPVAPGEIQVEAREERWLVRLPQGRLAWIARSHRGVDALRVERRVLRLLERRCAFTAPRVLFESTDGELDVRTVVPGIEDPWATYSLVQRDRRRGRRLGTAIGSILAEQHPLIGADDVADWLPSKPSWPEPRDRILERLPTVVDDRDLIARADEVMQKYENVIVDPRDRVLVHTDVGFHNLGIDATATTVHGIFDYDAAAWADRHYDFRYLVFDLEGYELLDAASAVYETAIGRPIQRGRVLLYNAACAVSYLAYRAGKRPEERWCGRTLAEDSRWSELAIARALSSAG